MYQWDMESFPNHCYYALKVQVSFFGSVTTVSLSTADWPIDATQTIH